MTDPLKALSRYRLPLNRDRLNQARDLTAPAIRKVRQNPFMLIGAVVVGAAGVLAWRNREKIAGAAGPLITDAKTKGMALVADAKAKRQNLMQSRPNPAATDGSETPPVRRGAAPETTVPEVH